MTSALIVPDEYRTERKRQQLSARQAHLAAIRARYDAAQTNRNNENHWAEADSLSAAAANSPGVRQKLRDRSRYECANNTYAAGMVSTLTNDTIGTGPSLQMMTGDQEFDAAIEEAWWKWSVAARLADKLRTMRMAQTRDGETFAMFTTNRPLRHAVKLDLRLFEAEQIAAPWQVVDVNSNFDGIVFDDFGNPLAYTLLRRHPGDTGYLRFDSFDYDTVPARDMLHLFRCERPGQVRGVPEIMPALPLYAQLRRFTLAVIAAAEAAADLAGVIHTLQAPDDPDDVEPLDEIPISKRMLLTLPRGWGIEQFRPEQPATTYQMFKREIINEIARCLNMPYNVAAGDSSEYNYASGRLDHKTYFKSIRVDRTRLEIDALDPIFGRWWEEARLVAGVLPQPLREMREPPPHSWGWDGDEHVDPLKEANAQETRLRTLMTSAAREYAKQNLDWRDEFEQIAGELGITFEQLLELRREALFQAPAAQPDPNMQQGQDE